MINPARAGLIFCQRHHNVRFFVRW